VNSVTSFFCVLCLKFFSPVELSTVIKSLPNLED
jgi:hypothetical protein